MRDMIVVGAVVVAFATLVTVDVTIVAGLLGRRPRWRALVAFLVPPVAPLWAWQEGMKVRAGLWVGALALYLIARVVAHF